LTSTLQDFLKEFPEIRISEVGDDASPTLAFRKNSQRKNN
jgi:hypothetical protein